MIEQPTVRLFSYGTPRQAEVQRSLFGRELTGVPDALPGYRLATVEITDPHVVVLSGSAHHPILRPAGDPVRHGRGHGTADHGDGTGRGGRLRGRRLRAHPGAARVGS
ncbi:hypothetical protein ACH4PU_25450 [Streptomyces sp. NPDC021100]|uniref:hypothetical protein n=1 Tax=Streptomyces sp. NPDC021100 TaxID=3365114 RepID=UPI003799D3FD